MIQLITESKLDMANIWILIDMYKLRNTAPFNTDENRAIYENAKNVLESLRTTGSAEVYRQLCNLS